MTIVKNTNNDFIYFSHNFLIQSFSLEIDELAHFAV